jgi:cytochrome oxidase Cu insertion factor (SCO1/SenC/PrrC family)
MNRFILAFTGLLPLLAFAQPVIEQTCTIVGTAPGREGNVIGVYQYDDFITATERKLQETIIGDSGKFTMSIEVSEVTYIALRCQNSQGHLFAEPGRTIELVFPTGDKKSMVNPNVTYTIPVEIYIGDSTDMNFLASDYNETFDRWWGSHWDNIVTKDTVSELDSFHIAMLRRYAWVKNPYFIPWMEYGLAAMEDATFHSPSMLARKYIVGKKIHYRNSEYMGFFNNFFKNYVYKWSMRREGEGIRFAINNMGSYDSLYGTLRRLPLMQNDTLRELVMLKGLFELYDNPAYDPRAVLAIAQQAAARSKIAEHRLIARNIVSFYTRLKKGSPAPLFTAIDRKGADVDPISLNKGKYIYLFFFDSKNPYSVAELRYMAELQKRYGKKIVFVTVSVDEDTLAWKAFLKANPKYNWTMLHFDFRQKTKEDYNLYSVPAGYIIDPEGKFYAAPVDNPSGDVEYLLYRIANPRAAPLIKPGER